MVTPHRYGLAELAEALFASALQESEHPTPRQVRAAVSASLSACLGDCTACAARVAQEAGDHPEQFLRRMRWALRTVEQVYGQEPLLWSMPAARTA